MTLWVQESFHLLLAMIDDPDVALNEWEGLVLKDLDEGFDLSRLALQIKFRDHGNRSFVIRIDLFGFLQKNPSVTK